MYFIELAHKCVKNNKKYIYIKKYKENISYMFSNVLLLTIGFKQNLYLYYLLI